MPALDRSILSALLLAAISGCQPPATEEETKGSSSAYAERSKSTRHDATKTLYEPQAEAEDYEKPPAGFVPVHTQLVARHGARGLSGMEDDLAVYNMALKAQADAALTARGASLVANAMAMMQANAVLGAGVPGITTPGYGNLTKLGLEDHAKLAKRMVERLPAHFGGLANGKRKIIVQDSGVARATDSANAFTASLADEVPALAPLFVRPAAPAGQTPGTNHFVLYFHKLKAPGDTVDATSPFFATYNASLAYQKYLSDPGVAAKLTEIRKSPQVTASAHAVLARLFTPEFVAKIDAGTYKFSNTGTFTFKSKDGVFTTTLTGDGKTTIASAVDAASLIYSLHSAAPALEHELEGASFDDYVTTADAAVFAYVSDAEDFYLKGPGISEDNPVTYKPAQSLQDDFFAQVDAIERGDTSTGASLRFSHAEALIPFTTLLGIKDAAMPVPKASTYTPANNPWRGEKIAPFTSNVQWDTFKNGSALAVRMLFNEKETDVKAACDTAKLAPDSHFYDYAKLKACYGHTSK